MSAWGRTIAVLGTGIQPGSAGGKWGTFRSHYRQRRPASTTQFPFNWPADKQGFPIRNRIVAGMTLGTVGGGGQSHQRSTHLSRPISPLEYGRQVFAVPGRIDSPRSKGCHDLIKKGAKLCEGAEDILSEFEYLFPASNRPAPTSANGFLPAIELSVNEKKVFDALDNEELSIDEVIRKSGLPSSAVSVALLGFGNETRGENSYRGNCLLKTCEQVVKLGRQRAGEVLPRHDQ